MKKEELKKDLIRLITDIDLLGWSEERVIHILRLMIACYEDIAWSFNMADRGNEKRAREMMSHMIGLVSGRTLLSSPQDLKKEEEVGK